MNFKMSHCARLTMPSILVTTGNKQAFLANDYY